MNFNEILASKLVRLFPDVRVRAEVEAVLGAYGREPTHQEKTRVHLAILKLSGSDLDKVKHNVQVALTDFRDVLYWAEYPRESALGYQADAAVTRKIRKQDAADYARWLEEGLED
ncbi:MAG: hypothetical protein ACE5EY_03520 [Anaerolineae bacterium]